MKKITLSLLVLLISFLGIAQSTSEFSLYNPTINPAPAMFPNGKVKVEFNFTVASQPFAFSSDDLSNNYGTVTFSFTKLNPTTVTPSGTGAALFNWILTDNGGTGVSKVYTYTGKSKDVTMNTIPLNVYKITFVDVIVTFPATQAQTDVRVAGQFTAPGNAGADSPTNNYAFIATYTTEGSVLPISLLDFTAAKQNKVVDLNWLTSTEQNSSHFDVEFSRDGSKFESIGKVNAAGSSSSVKNYALIHTSPVNGVNYYRLKLVDADGFFKYSAVRTVKFSSTKSINIMPNPTVDRVYITSNEGGLLQSVGLYSINGKLLQLVNNFVLGKSIDLSSYAPSIYILKLIDKDGSTEVIKVVRK